MALLLFFSVTLTTLFIIRKLQVSRWGHFSDKTLLSNKVFIVTGGNSGIGKETVKELALRDATIILACRDLNKATNTINDIRKNIKTGDMIPLELDLASFDSIRQFSNKIQQEFPKVDVLINNAGVAIPTQLHHKTKEGFEINFGTNHLGHFLLTNLLLDKLKYSAPSRIIIVTSKLHEGGIIDFDNLQGEKGFNSNLRNPPYNNSKLANAYFCRELAKRLPPDVETYSLCPGFCCTSLFRYGQLKWHQYILLGLVAFFSMRSANQGCQTVLYCAISDEVTGKSGKMFRDCKQFESSYCFDDDVQKKLWEVSEILTKLK